VVASRCVSGVELRIRLAIALQLPPVQDLELTSIIKTWWRSILDSVPDKARQRTSDRGLERDYMGRGERCKLIVQPPTAQRAMLRVIRYAADASVYLRRTELTMNSSERVGVVP
jgi:hypothetical protein